MNIIDLFAGAGGFSLGFEMAGYNVPLAIEKDEWASETYAFNHPDTQLITGDITQIDLPEGKNLVGSFYPPARVGIR